MNRVVAEVYAITIEGAPLSQQQKDRLIDLVPVLTAEINRLQKIASDPFVLGYLEAREQWRTP